jgi:hypothetical protein
MATPYGIVVLTATAEGISRVTAFGDPGLVTAFGFPSRPARGRRRIAGPGGREMQIGPCWRTDG